MHTLYILTVYFHSLLVYTNSADSYTMLYTYVNRINV